MTDNDDERAAEADAPPEHKGSGAHEQAPADRRAKESRSRHDVKKPGADTRRMEQMEQELEERKDRYVRLAADFENFKRRKAQEAEERARYANEDAGRQMLPLLDNLQRALSHVPDGTDGGLMDGLEMVVREFEGTFERLGITPIESEGRPFDPALHQAVLAEESPEVSEDLVAQELQRGYRLHDRVLRPAMVKVVHPANGAVVRSEAQE